MNFPLFYTWNQRHQKFPDEIKRGDYVQLKSTWKIMIILHCRCKRTTIQKSMKHEGKWFSLEMDTHRIEVSFVLFVCSSSKSRNINNLHSSISNIVMKYLVKYLKCFIFRKLIPRKSNDIFFVESTTTSIHLCIHWKKKNNFYVCECVLFIYLLEIPTWNRINRKFLQKTFPLKRSEYLC